MSRLDFGSKMDLEKVGRFEKLISSLKKMKKGILAIGTGLLVLSIASATWATMLIPASEQARERSQLDRSPVIRSTDDHLVLFPPGLEKKVFIHRKDDRARSPFPSKGKRPTSCYDFLGREVKWKQLPVQYVIDPDNLSGLSQEFVVSAINLATQEWDNYTATGLFDGYAVSYEASWDSDVPDGQNELLFGDYPQENVIAVTVVWGYFAGPPSTRQIVEFDILFDNDYAWGDGQTNATVMDLQNIATHELGHGLGLADIYEASCFQVTMYGYSDYGEVQKRTLEPADITGLQKLYGGI